MHLCPCKNEGPIQSRPQPIFLRIFKKIMSKSGLRILISIDYRKNVNLQKQSLLASFKEAENGTNLSFETITRKYGIAE